MGQRLVATCFYEREPICKIYFHWSGYTRDSLYEARKIIDLAGDFKNKTELLENIFEGINKLGGGISVDEFEQKEKDYISNSFSYTPTFNEHPNRNEGLFSMHPEGMEKTQMWSEGDVYIDFDHKEISDYCNWVYDSLDEYEYEVREYRGINMTDAEWKEHLEKIPTTDIDFEYCKFSDLDRLIEEADACNFVLRCGNSIYEFIG